MRLSHELFAKYSGSSCDTFSLTIKHHPVVATRLLVVQDKAVGSDADLLAQENVRPNQDNDKSTVDESSKLCGNSPAETCDVMLLETQDSTTNVVSTFVARSNPPRTTSSIIEKQKLKTFLLINYIIRQIDI